MGDIGALIICCHNAGIGLTLSFILKSFNLANLAYCEQD
jgi:hypothetical protein